MKLTKTARITILNMVLLAFSIYKADIAHNAFASAYDFGRACGMVLFVFLNLAIVVAICVYASRIFSKS